MELGQRYMRNNEALANRRCHCNSTIFHLSNKQLKCSLLFFFNRINIYAVKWLCDQCADLGFQNFLFDSIVLLAYVTIYIYIYKKHGFVPIGTHYLTECW